MIKNNVHLKVKSVSQKFHLKKSGMLAVPNKWDFLQSL